MKETTNMNLDKQEQKFIAENITRYDVVTGITVNEMEVRIHYKEHGGTGSTAMYRTANIADIYAHVASQAAAIDRAFGGGGFDSKGWMKNTKAGKE